MATPHIVAIAFPFPGHINPLLYLCKRLQPFGFQITIVNNHANHKAMFKSHAPVNKDGMHYVGIPDGLPEPTDGALPPSGLEGIKAVINSTEGMQPAMEELVHNMFKSGNPVACIISDSFIHWTQDIANKHGFPRAAIAFSCATYEIIMLNMRRLKEEGFMPVNTRTTGDKLIDFIPGMPSFSPLDIPMAHYDEHPSNDFLTVAYERLLEADWILSTTFGSLEIHPLSIIHNHYGFKNYLPVGPFLPDSHLFPESDINKDRLGLSDANLNPLNWLDSRSDSSVLYIAFGSIAELSKEQFLELTAALEESDHSTLWAVRPSLVEDFPHEQFNQFVERTKDRIHVCSWASQIHILRHPAVGGFLTHCGWNSVTESICAGVPMICWPCVTEQNVTCSLLLRNKLGIPLQKSPPELIGKYQIVKAVDELMNGEAGEEVRQNVKTLGEEAKKGAKKGGSSYINLEAFAKAISANKY